MQLRETVAQNITDARKAAGFSQERLAKCLKVTKQTIWRVEAGLTNISVDMLADIGRALDIEPALLLLPNRRLEQLQAFGEHIERLTTILEYLARSIKLVSEYRASLTELRSAGTGV